MKGKLELLMVTAALCPMGLQAHGIECCIDRLAATTNYHSEATVDVQLPQGADVNYNVDLWSSATGNDTLAPCSYLIEWKLPTPDGVAEGFTAYNDRHLYRHTGDRLQEYHFQWDSIPFLLNNTRSGVQRNTQFCNLLPQFIAEELREMTTSPQWTCNFTPDTICNGLKSTVVTGQMTVNGYVGKEVTYVLDPSTSLPRYIEIENNPTSISEQVLVIKYNTTASSPMPTIDEQALTERYPDVFDRLRESNFTVETMRGKPLPAFSLPTTTGQRFQRQKGDPFASTTLVALLDAGTATNGATIEALRKAVDILPMAADIIFAFVNTDIDTIESTVPSLRRGEHLLTSARSLARDCGITSCPTILVAGSDGKVKDVIIGFNKNLSTDVIEKASLIE